MSALAEDLEIAEPPPEPGEASAAMAVPPNEIPPDERSVPNRDASAFRFYISEIRRTRLLTAEEEQDLARRARAGDRAARDRMVAANTRLVVQIARRHTSNGMELADLVSEGNVGLLHAVDKFDPDRGFRFSTYASWWIHQAIQRGVMNQSRMIRIPVHILKERTTYHNAERDLWRATGRKPTPEEVIQKTGQSIERVRDLLALNDTVTSADAVIGSNPNNDATLMDTFAAEASYAPEARMEGEQALSGLESLLSILKPRHRLVIRRRFGLGGYDTSTLSEIAAEIGVTRERVRQIQTESLKLLRQRARALGINIATLI